MKKDLNSKRRPSGSTKMNEPKVIGEVLNEYLASNEPLAVAYRNRLFKDIHPHTELGVDLKLLTREPGRIPVGTMIDGAIVHDDEVHFTFIQNDPEKKMMPVKRNPHVFNGRYITVTRKDDGTLRLNFKHFNMGAGFNIERYALWVHNEICMALRGLVEER